MVSNKIQLVSLIVKVALERFEYLRLCITGIIEALYHRMIEGHIDVNISIQLINVHTLA